MDAQGSPKCLRGVVFEGSWSSPGTLLSAPGLLWGTIWDAWAEHLERFGLIFGTQGGVQSENSEQLEFADHLNENAMFLKSQGLQNEAKMVPKRAEKRKKSREEGKGEQRSAKHLVQTVQRCHKSTVQNGLRRHPEISGIPGGAFGAFLDDFLCY